MYTIGKNLVFVSCIGAFIVALYSVSQNSESTKQLLGVVEKATILGVITGFAVAMLGLALKAEYKSLRWSVSNIVLLLIFFALLVEFL